MSEEKLKLKKLYEGSLGDFILMILKGQDYQLGSDEYLYFFDDSDSSISRVKREGNNIWIQISKPTERTPLYKISFVDMETEHE